MMARFIVNKLFALLCQNCVCNPAFALNPEEFDWGREDEQQTFQAE